MRGLLELTVRQVRLFGALGAVVAMLSTVGCSSVPDAVNPVEWYKGTRDWISGDEKAEPAIQTEAIPVPNADKPFPKLASVPERPPQSTAAERAQMANSLIADRETARYSDEQIRRQNSSVVTGTIPPVASEPPVSRPPPASASPSPVTVQQVPAAPVAAPVQNSASQVATIPNQPIPVIPVPPPPPVEPSPPQPVQMPAAPSFTPPPPPVVVGSGVPSPEAFPPRQLDIPERPPVVNPSGGGPGFSAPAPLIPPEGGFVGADRFAPRFPNQAALPQQPVYETPTYEAPAAGTAQSLQPGSQPVATILFADGSARIGNGDREIIRQVYNEYRRRGGRIYIIGHASSRTRNLDQASHQLANFSISYARARAVASVFERLGVPPQSIVVEAMSDQQPNYFEVMPAGEAGNRRAEIFLEN